MDDPPPGVPPRRQRGRPMNAEVERRLLDAAIDVLDADGVGGLTVDAICERAGVPRSTFYRRWKSAPDAVGAAVKEIVGGAIPVTPDTGDTREDVVTMALGMAQLLNEGRFGRILAFMMAEVQQNPDFREAALAIARHRRQFPAELVARGQAAERLSPDLDAELLVEVLVGALIFRRFFGESPPDRAYIEKLADLIVRPAEDRVTGGVPTKSP